MKREALIEMFSSCCSEAEVYETLDLGYASRNASRDERLQWFLDFQNLVITDDDVRIQNQKDVEAGISFRDDENGDEIPCSMDDTRAAILRAQQIIWHK